MDGIKNWKNLKQKLSFKGLGCCGAIWSRTRSITTLANIVTEEDQEHDRESSVIGQVSEEAAEEEQEEEANSGMNLAMALAAERNLRDEMTGDAGQVKTLMRLIEETDGVDYGKKNKTKDQDDGGDEDGGNVNDWGCCVCMERNKGAAFIPCGHSFCRACSREMWVNRGSCPICNRWIQEILHIF